MNLTINQMQQQLLLAYQTSKKRPAMSLDFGISIDKRTRINMYFYNQGCCQSIEIYSWQSERDRMESFKLALSCINGELNPFEVL